jgi:hypothetical protein
LSRFYFKNILFFLTNFVIRCQALILYQAWLPFLSPAQTERALPCFLVCVDIIGTVAKLAVDSQESEKIVEELRRMIVMHVAAMLDLDLSAPMPTSKRRKR